MAEKNPNLEELSRKLDYLLEKQAVFQKEIYFLQKQMEALKTRPSEDPPKEIPSVEFPASPKSTSATTKAPEKLPEYKKPVKPAWLMKSNLEKFIGENLINKIGIVILVIGVAIGAKYSIENNLISPLTRIVLGYLAGLILLLTGIRLIGKYKNYSAVLVSGAMMIFYFITFFAYDFYALIPQGLSFALMVIFTVFTVTAALYYDQIVIAIIGLVGAYAIPMLLSEGSGNQNVLFSYILIIDAGILFIAFKKSWKLLYYLSFAFTWLIFFSWYLMNSYEEEITGSTMIFSMVYFMQFYTIFLAYKIVAQEKFQLWDIVMILLNSFIYFGVNYDLLNQQSWGDQFLGLFTLGNAILHFLATLIVYRSKLADRNLFYLVSGMVLVFITLAVPIQLDGDWVTLIWILEALLIFWIGRTKSIKMYEQISYVLIFLAFISLVDDWNYVHGDLTNHLPLLNIHFLSGVIFSAIMGFIYYLYSGGKYVTSLNTSDLFYKSFNLIIPAVLLITVFTTFYLEILAYFSQQFRLSEIVNQQGDDNYPNYYHNYDWKLYSIVWATLYTMSFVSLLSWINIKKLHHLNFSKINLVLNALVQIIFLALVLWNLGLLRESFLDSPLSEYYSRPRFNLYFRYIAMAIFAILLWTSYKLITHFKYKQQQKNMYELSMHISILWLLSSELFHWMDIIGSENTYKTAVSILWGLYAFFLVTLGIWKNKKLFRIFGIGLFGITLFKLFIYDLTDLNTIKKTIVFIALGILMLLISFLYNKFKDKINPDENT